MMRPSFESVNYSVRPAKSIERKMLCESFVRLMHFGNINAYKYIGFGSPYFSDFYLLHRQLGITRMINIEQESNVADRFEFNRPFECIQMRYGHSNDILDTVLTEDEKFIVWLDYDGKLNQNVLTDIHVVLSTVSSGSMFVVSVNARPARPYDTRVRELKKQVGADNVPLGVTDQSLADWGTAKAYYTIISSKIAQLLHSRNGGLAYDKRLRFKQLFHFHYADGANMLTVGGLLYENRHTELVERCAFGDLTYVREDEVPFTIAPPNLTYREMRWLDSQLPCDSLDDLTAPGIPLADIEKYRQLYRYFPTFVEAEM